MGFFKTEGMDYMDYTLLKKKGILKVQESKNEFVDLTPSLVPTPSTTPSSQGTSDFTSFFGSVDATPPSNITNPFAGVDSSTPLSSNNTSSPDLNALKIKLEDFEYKLERLLERLANIESKLAGSVGF